MVVAQGGLVGVVAPDVVGAGRISRSWPWAAHRAERVLPLFRRVHPEEEQPRPAIKACRERVATRVFRMADIRGSALAAVVFARPSGVLSYPTGPGTGCRVGQGDPFLT
ncbi:putative immunity protein [Streptomyces sp. NPDC005246]|uniref:putative immunity protein n=1 Tax=Streptomyces sp. NPDC005246 TaxID=3156716 RepID=UPI0033B1C9E3